MPDLQKTFDDLMKRLKQMNLVDVTRCKDCKHSTTAQFMPEVYCHMHLKYVNKDFYCAFGAKEESNG